MYMCLYVHVCRYTHMHEQTHTRTHVFSLFNIYIMGVLKTFNNRL